MSTLLSETKISQAANLAPVTLVSRTLRSPGVDSVLTNDVHGRRARCAYMIEPGHRRIVHIDGGRNPGSRLRRQGYERAMDAAGLERLVVPGDFSESSGAGAAMDRLAEAGYSISADISMVGYDRQYGSGAAKAG